MMYVHSIMPMSTLSKVSAPLDALQVAKCFVHIAHEQKVPVPETGEEIREDIHHLKLQKLLYFAQAAHLAIHGTPLFSDRIQAWAFGPVIPAVYEHFRRYGSGPIAVEEGECSSDTLKNFLLEVWKLFGKYSAIELMNISHKVGPWSEYYRGGRDNTVIPESAIQEAFTPVFTSLNGARPSAAQKTTS